MMTSPVANIGYRLSASNQQSLGCARLTNANTTWPLTVARVATPHSQGSSIPVTDNGANTGTNTMVMDRPTIPPVLNHVVTAPGRSTKPASQKAEVEKVKWFDYWWPVAPVDQVDTSRPMAFTLMGIPLAIWKDSKGVWHAFQDRCPHRLAPLSEGVVMKDELMCSYHGWQFNQQGKCTQIPQIEDPKAHATACNVKRNCTSVYPIKVVHGLLWVFPQPGEKGEALAAANPVPQTALQTLLEAEKDPQGSNFYQSTAWFMRDMPVSYTTLVENTIDPSHVFFAHHGAPGVKRENLVNPVMSTPGNKATVTAKGGFMVTRHAVKDSPESQYGLVPPNLISYTYPYSESHFYCIPTKPGWSRIITCIVGKKDAKVPKPLQFMSKLMSKYPVIEHVILRHDILDGDLYMLHAGERALIKEGNNAKSYYMPANADLAVILWRKWLARHGGDIPTCSKADEALIGPLMSKEQVLDRYTQHTASCQTCQQALRTIDKVNNIAMAVGLVALIYTVHVMSTGMPLLSAPPILGALATLACVGMHRAMQSLRHKFFYQEYVHAHRHAPKPTKA